MRKKKIAFGLLIFGLLWWFFSGGPEKWKEEVQLSDGRIIVVERIIIFEGGGDEIVSNRSGSKHKEYSIRFHNSSGSGKMIEWKSTKKDDRMWPEIPLVFDFEAGLPIVYASVYVRDGCENYLKYIYKEDSWNEETLPARFSEHKTNLLLRIGTDMPRFVDLKDKKKMNSEPGYRKSLRKVGPNREICG